ncbi:protein mono-ADP-ribosyltransferase PARP4-like isoform X5 [Lytechinus variegatus]|nr:protein mono-ADP-ribosyltransferase PARP4-like isoform X5 [Lytechinus variegatus]
MIVDESKRRGFSHKCSKAQKLNIPIVSVSYVDDCVAASRLLNPTPYLVVDTQAQSRFGHGKISGIRQRKDKDSIIKKRALHVDLHSVRVYSWNDPKAPDFPSEGQYLVARSLLLDSVKEEKNGKHIFYQLELHAVKKDKGERMDTQAGNEFMYRVFSHHGNVNELKDEESGVRECRYLKTSQAAVDIYRQLYEQRIKPPWKMKRCKKMISRWIGSPTFRKDSFDAGYLAGEKLSSDLVALVEQIWMEAIGHLNDILSCPMDRVSRDQVEKGECILLQIKEGLDANRSQAVLLKLSHEYYDKIPHKKQPILKTKQDITREQGLCQLLSDVHSVCEATDWSMRGSTEAKYRTLRCHMELLTSESAEYEQISKQIQDSLTGGNSIEVKRIFAVERFVESSNFAHHLGNKKLLFHSSKPSNFLGILSRGLLMPKIVVDDLGVSRTDAGMLGHGIYFADSASTSACYSVQSKLSNSRFLMICEVSLGRCHEVTKYHPDLDQPPSGFDSVKGLGAVAGQIASDFSANEFTIYNVNQQRLRYLVEFTLPEDQTDTPSSFIPDLPTVPMETDDTKEQPIPPPVEMKDVLAVPNPNDKVVSGLQSTSSKPIPLKNVCVRAKMMDLAAQVVIFQEYDNVNRESIEAKYVFPLEDSAAVCGFEAFIGDKHIVGTVKEKEQAHKEYKEAISKGHGAYLMDEEAPDVFTVSVGNLPPKVKVVIKITYVIELSVEGDKIAFSLPGSVAPWRKEAAISQVLQKDVATLKVKDQSSISFSLAVSVEMATDITAIQSTTHPLKIKQTATKAVITLPDDCKSLGEGFQLLVGVTDIHRPRMWVEQHPENKDSQACMVTFYPDFEASSVEKPEIVLLLDCSNSMKGEPLKQAKKILLLTLHHMADDCIFNVVTFGTGFEELFAGSQAKTESSVQAATSFINQACATQGNTDAWRPLQSYFLLRSEGLQNLFLVSDGHINNEQSTLDAISQNTHSRIFTFGISSSSNRHLLKGMARVGRGAFEFFDNNAKSKWESKVKAQLSKAKQPSVSSLEVQWKQHDNDPPTPVQAPRQLTSLFNGSRLVVYGFVQYCTEACLKASIDGEEVSTMVSTPELCITKGQMLHRLTARAVIRDWEDGTLDPDKTHHEARKNQQKSYVIDLSKKYSIVTQLTSFVAIEKREKGEDLKGRSVSLVKLAEKEDVDFLSYMDWQKTVRLDSDEDVDPMRKVEDLLEQANKESTFSVLKAEEYYEQALDIATDHLPDSTEVYLKTASALHEFLRNSKRELDKADQLSRKVKRARWNHETLKTDQKLVEMMRAMFSLPQEQQQHGAIMETMLEAKALSADEVLYKASIMRKGHPRQISSAWAGKKGVLGMPLRRYCSIGGARPPSAIGGRGGGRGAGVPPPPPDGIFAPGAPPPPPPGVFAAPPPPQSGFYALTPSDGRPAAAPLTGGVCDPPPPPPGVFAAPPPPPPLSGFHAPPLPPPSRGRFAAPAPPPPTGSGLPAASAPHSHDGAMFGAPVYGAVLPPPSLKAASAPHPPPPPLSEAIGAPPPTRRRAARALPQSMPAPPPRNSGHTDLVKSIGLNKGGKGSPKPRGTSEYQDLAGGLERISDKASSTYESNLSLLDIRADSLMHGSSVLSQKLATQKQTFGKAMQQRSPSAYSPTSPPTSPIYLAYSPTSPAYSPASPAYAQVSRDFDSSHPSLVQQAMQSVQVFPCSLGSGVEPASQLQKVSNNEKDHIHQGSTMLAPSIDVEFCGFGVDVDDDLAEERSECERGVIFLDSKNEIGREKVFKGGDLDTTQSKKRETKKLDRESRDSGSLQQRPQFQRFNVAMDTTAQDFSQELYPNGRQHLQGMLDKSVSDSTGKPQSLKLGTGTHAHHSRVTETPFQPDNWCGQDQNAPERLEQPEEVSKTYPESPSKSAQEMESSDMSLLHPNHQANNALCPRQGSELEIPDVNGPASQEQSTNNHGSTELPPTSLPFQMSGRVSKPTVGLFGSSSQSDRMSFKKSESAQQRTAQIFGGQSQGSPFCFLSQKSASSSVGTPNEFSFGDQSQGTDLGGQSHGSLFGAQSQKSGFDGQSNRFSFGGQSQGTGFRDQSQGSPFSSQSQGSLFGNQSQGSLFGGQTQGSLFGGQLQKSGFDNQPQESPFSSPSQGTGFSGQSQVPLFGGPSKGIGFGSQLQGSPFSGQSQGSLFGGQLQKSGFDNQPQESPFSSPSQGTGFSGQSQVPLFGGPSKGIGFGSQPQGSPFNVQSQGFSFGSQSQMPRFDRPSIGLFFGSSTCAIARMHSAVSGVSGVSSLDESQGSVSSSQHEANDQAQSAVRVSNGFSFGGQSEGRARTHSDVPRVSQGFSFSDRSRADNWTHANAPVASQGLGFASHSIAETQLRDSLLSYEEERFQSTRRSVKTTQRHDGDTIYSNELVLTKKHEASEEREVHREKGRAAILSTARMMPEEKAKKKKKKAVLHKREEEQKKGVLYEQDDVYCLMETGMELNREKGDKGRDRDREKEQKEEEEVLDVEFGDFTTMCGEIVLEEEDDEFGSIDFLCSMAPAIEGKKDSVQSDLLGDRRRDRDKAKKQKEEEALDVLFGDLEECFDALEEERHKEEVYLAPAKRKNVQSDLLILEGGSSEESDDDMGYDLFDEEEGTEEETEEEGRGKMRQFWTGRTVGRSLRMSLSRSRSRSRARSRSRSPSDGEEVTVEEMTSRVYTRPHELGMWQRALCTGNIPESFPGWTTGELSVLKQAVNGYMMTLEPFVVPVIVESLPDKDTLESLLVLDLFSCVDDPDDDDDDASSSDEWEPELQLFFTLGKHVSFVKLFGLLKNAGIYSLGGKIGGKLLRVLMVSLVVCCAQKLSSTKPTDHLNLNQLTHYIQHLEIARTDSWIEVASRMIAN